MAIHTATANEQHYEVGTGVLQACLGPRMKYSCCLYPKGSETLGQAEMEMLDLYVDRAELRDGMRVLDLGYAPGFWLHSLSFHLAVYSMIPSFDTDFSCATKLRLGFCRPVLRRGLPKISDHIIFKFQDAKGLH